jgi:hypothetical protein
MYLGNGKKEITMKNNTQKLSPAISRVAFSICLAASCAAAQPAGEKPNWLSSKEILNYQLTMEKVDKWAGATRGMIVYTKTHPEVLAKIQLVDKEFTPKTVDDLVAFAKIKAGEYVAIVESNGVSFREYLLVSGVIITTKFVVDYGINPGPVNPANITFLKTNRAKLDALLAEYDSLATGGSR